MKSGLWRNAWPEGAVRPLLGPSHQEEPPEQGKLKRKACQLEAQQPHYASNSGQCSKQTGVQLVREACCCILRVLHSSVVDRDGECATSLGGDAALAGTGCDELRCYICPATDVRIWLAITVHCAATQQSAWR